MSESFIIDRIESGFVVAETEDETMVNIPENLIKGDFKEGDILIKEDEFFKVDSDLTKKRKEEIDHMLKNMWQ
ncbi:MULTISPECIES: DUF3006 domain-containing protein [Clostridium]|jgi:hypothetical protein|uniref:DUF3006 domain-containing protein n=1 Tax=Clostridium butyricum TaxID=1492 RepID=A0A0A6PYW4_CLOBU|nr:MULTISPECIES: DUF3006 domain-containing protein [Clostridium]ETI88870.1 MAG: hypothetical protein Q607_CBUC00189G0014 [Clostridium butyricum DORA_1]ALP91730.1 hypothetical protein ATN24_16730 [Clostridium butyricum]ALS18227.1 hypothetical protein ATD26_15450 [Clostridium butyricum]ANF15350.1 hypothetical protein AZ909_15185 [Clostridium butyricum]AOR95299.1 hypothetical protein BBB49_14745 [Clostridium butyricum]